MSQSAAAPSPTRARYIGIDLARLLAVAGMMAAHLVSINAMNPGAPLFEQRAGEIAELLTGGIAAPLFAVLGGLSAVFATRRALAAGQVGRAVLAVALRGVILILLGLGLGFLDVPIVVVLVYYGAAMLLVAPLIAARSWLLALIALIVGIASGPLNAFVRGELGIVGEAGSPSYESLAVEPVETLRGVFLTGTYPAVTWLVYLIIGVLIARVLLAASARGQLGRVALAVGAVGAALAVATSLVSQWVLANLSVFGVVIPEGIDESTFAKFLAGEHFGAPGSAEVWSQLIASPHSGSPMDILHTIGIAAAVIGLLVALFDRSGRAPGRVLDVFRAAGAAPLTIYSLHLIVTAWLFSLAMADPATHETGVMPWWFAGLGAWALQLGGALVIGAILSAIGRRGPLEALTSGIVRTVTRT